VVADEQTVVVTTITGEVVGLDHHGEIQWRSKANAEIQSLPVISGTHVIVRTLDHRVIAFDTLTGKRQWLYQHTPPGVIFLRTPLQMIALRQGVLADTLLLGFEGGRLVALNMTTGQPRWQTPVAIPKGASEIERLTELTGVAVRDKTFCASTFQGRLACGDLASGQLIWGRDFSSPVGLDMDERFVFAVDEQSRLTAYARDNGNSVWRNEALRFRQLSTPVSSGRSVVAADQLGVVHWFDREEGRLIGRLLTDGSPIRFAPQLLGERWVVQTRNGGVYMVQP
jgi:outer membrane protein assembly factor BamB